MKTQRMLKSIFGTAVIALLLLMAPCDAANPSALVGRWVIPFGDDRGEVLELLSDGTGIINSTDSKGKKTGVAFTWKTEKDRFYVNFITFGTTMAESGSYKLQGSELTMAYDNDGKIAKYIKCNKDCKAIVEEYEKAAAEEAKAKAEATLRAKAAKGSFTDSRDGKTYKTVKLDNQTWMAENLNYNASGSKCYDNNESNCQKYGRLYDWKTANAACPIGWHLPSDKEWQTLVDFAGGHKVVGKALKASSGWSNKGNGTDEYGFAALPGGRGASFARFNSGGNEGYWWSSREGNAYSWNMFYYAQGISSSNDNSRLLSVRCVKD